MIFSVTQTTWGGIKNKTKFARKTVYDEKR